MDMNAIYASVKAISTPAGTPQLYQPQPPDPNKLFMGTTITVADWFRDFQAYVNATHHGKIRNRQWYSVLWNLCANHPGMRNLLEAIPDHDQKKLSRLQHRIGVMLFPLGQENLENAVKAKYYANIDMPNPDDPLQVLAVHRRRLMAFEDDELPDRATQVDIFLRAVSPFFRDKIAQQGLTSLTAVEKWLRDYQNTMITTASASSASSHTPTNIFAALGGGDPTGNPISRPLDWQAMMQQLRQDITNDIKASLPPPTTPIFNVDATSKRVRFDLPPSPRRGRYGERMDDEESDDGRHPPPPKRPAYGGYSPRFCRHCAGKGRDNSTTHNTDDCFNHPNGRLAQANREKAAARGVRVPMWRPNRSNQQGQNPRQNGMNQQYGGQHQQSGPSSPRHDRSASPPTTPTTTAPIDPSDPRIKSLVEKGVSQRLETMRQTFRTMDMLKTPAPPTEEA